MCKIVHSLGGRDGCEYTSLYIISNTPHYTFVLQAGDLIRKDPFEESGLRLSPTAAEAKEKARAKRANKRAPQMDWSKKHEIFSNF